MRYENIFCMHVFLNLVSTHTRAHHKRMYQVVAPMFSPEYTAAAASSSIGRGPSMKNVKLSFSCFKILNHGQKFYRPSPPPQSLRRSTPQTMSPFMKAPFAAVGSRARNTTRAVVPANQSSKYTDAQAAQVLQYVYTRPSAWSAKYIRRAVRIALKSRIQG